MAVQPRVSARRRPVKGVSRCGVRLSSGEKEGTKCETTWQRGLDYSHGRTDQNIS